MEKRTGNREDSPVLSVVIPVYNDPRGIRMTLETVAEQTYPSEEYEILAVDNGSTDGTREVIRAFSSFYDNVHLLIEDEIQGSYAARNEGIRQARGDLIAFIDADVTVEDTWAKSIVDSFEKYGWDYMGYNIETYIEGEETLGAVYDHLLGGFPVRYQIEEKNFTVTAALVVRREVIEAVGSFDERYTSQGDGEFGKRVAEAGFSQHFEPTITAYHPTRSTLRAWLEKQVRIGRGSVQLRSYHPTRTDSNHPFDPQNFLPPKPWYFYERLTDATCPTHREVLILYGVDYLSKLARARGRVEEWTEQRRK